ncbi:B3 domain-containing transcription factor ABI3 [Humulus lupulus]|uniref:B3 domain-containing transcription factor ABI3 n=1 Tax=Humulus lupulus TaxID=3486 RepID=UPI002B409E56|nr:B3 domain-containing transcription factor ABI3 [Humulus lupulus]
MKSSTTMDTGDHGQDLVHAEEVDSGRENPNTGFVVMDIPEEDMWLENDIQEHDRDHQDLLDVNEASIFYSEFPALPDFPCMSSSSSSSSTPATVKAITCSSSSSSVSSSTSAASWAVLKSDAEEDVEKIHGGHQNNLRHHYNKHDPGTTPAALSSTASMDFSEQPGGDDNPGLDCIDMMETFGYMDLLESNEFFDPSSIFQNDSVVENSFQEELLVVPRADHEEEEEKEHGENLMMIKNGKNDEMMMMMMIENDQEIEELENDDKEAPDEMAMVFLDWLRTNKETVSADDLRSVKIKKSTIEAAAKRLGGGKEAMKQLLKLVLEWVKTNHLQKRRMKETSPFHSTGVPTGNNDQYQIDPNPNPSNLNSNAFTTHEPNNPNCFAHSPWNYDPAPTVVVPSQAYPSPVVGFMGSDPFVNGSGSYQPIEYTNNNNMLDSSPTWPPSQFSLASPYPSFPDNNGLQTTPSQHAQAFSGYGSQYPYQYYSQEGDQRLVRSGSSATKEARKKRMARQRRLLSHHRHHHHHHHNNNHHHQNQNQIMDHQHARLNRTTDMNCTNIAPPQPNPANWVYWPQAAVTAAGAASPPPLPSGITAETPPLHPVDRHQTQSQNNFQGRSPTERRLGWKPEKNLRFLLQKVLKQSDVGSLGRIVLPKKEAETHLPELEARDGISIPMEDIGTSRIWNMRYRYWPNNKSRMYLLENTGDFVRANGLQEGDFIVIYSDIKCGKYMIRGVKVRQQGPNPNPKSENKRPGKSQRNQHTSSPAGTNNINSNKNHNNLSSITERKQ